MIERAVEIVSRYGDLTLQRRGEARRLRRGDDDRETPAIDAEVRLARQLGNPRFVRFSQRGYGDLDAYGHWRN